jgi:HlyD family secretion protein
MPHSPHSRISPDSNGRSGYNHATQHEASDNRQIPLDRPTELSQSERDCSYATQELLDALPRVWTRGLLYLAIAFTAIILPWAMLSKVDETGTARGRLEPKGKTIRLDAPVEGKVAAIKVKEGQAVKAGQSLLVLESEQVLSELLQAQAKLEGQQQRLPLLTTMAKQIQTTIRTQQLYSQSQIAAQLAEINQIQQQMNLHQFESSAAQALLVKDRDILQRYQNLRQQGIISVLQVDDAERTAIDNKQRWQKARLDLKQAQAELKKQQSTYESVLRQGELSVADNQRQMNEIQTQIALLKAEIAQTKRQIESLLFQLQRRVISSPIHGTIFQLPIQSPGVIVQPSQIVATIAPKGTSLILKAQMASPESGFIRLGMPVKVKFDAYPFQDYGVVPGRLTWISPDSKLQKTDRGEIEIFELEIALERLYIQNAERRITLKPGQTATAEVIVRQRRAIDFILDPFKQLQQGGLKL